MHQIHVSVPRNLICHMVSLIFLTFNHGYLIVLKIYEAIHNCSSIIMFFILKCNRLLK